MKQKLQSSVDKLSNWIERNGYQAYDPADGNSSFLHALTFNNLLLERLLQQIVYRAPFNLRPCLGIHPHISTKGMGYLAWAYTSRFPYTRAPRDRERALHCLQWLLNNRSLCYPDFCWGNHFPFASRAGKIPAFEPTLVWTSLIGQAFLAAYEAFQHQPFLDVAWSICQWILKLPREKTPTGICLSYVAFKQCSIHNSNMLGASFLAQVGKYAGASQVSDLARAAMEYTSTRQNSAGSWFYAEHPRYRWIDNFHTAYILDSLKRFSTCTGDTRYASTLQRGLGWFKRHFFEPDGRPKYYHDKAFPIDIQCAAQAIDTLALFADSDDDCLPLALQVARWTIDHMQAEDGHFYYRDLGWVMNKTPMLHWGQATMFKALSHLMNKLASSGDHSVQRRQA